MGKWKEPWDGDGKRDGKLEKRRNFIVKAKDDGVY